MAKIYKCLRIKSAHKAESALVEDFWGKQANVVALLISERLGIMRLLTWLLLFTAVFLRRFCGLQKMRYLENPLLTCSFPGATVFCKLSLNLLS
uniref:Uncharacterized protein n=1 Tax=Physcomitrium patens TaxID=3218 RepID=A0A2K1J9S3_PHYPA|nr:hypothetical protein PHYPA_021385 [Physcomitrium patens]